MSFPPSDRFVPIVPAAAVAAPAPDAAAPPLEETALAPLQKETAIRCPPPDDRCSASETATAPAPEETAPCRKWSALRLTPPRPPPLRLRLSDDDDRPDQRGQLNIVPCVI